MYSSENSQKATSNADLTSRVGQPNLCRSTGLSSRLSDFCSSLFSVLLLSPVSFYSPLSSSAPFYGLPSSIFSRIFLSSSTSGLAHRSFVWVSRQNRQRDRLTGTHTHQHNECPTSCHILLLMDCLFRDDFQKCLLK